MKALRLEIMYPQLLEPITIALHCNRLSYMHLPRSPHNYGRH